MSTQRRLIISPLAAADLDEIAGYIGRENPRRAASFVRELEATCRSIAETPQSFAMRADLAPGIRMAVHGRYLIFFRDLPDDETVRIERVLHGARNLRRFI